MKRYCFIFIALIFIACTTDEKKVSQEELAVQAAKAYYDQLIHGDYTSFVAGTDGYESIPASYREQLETNMKQFVERQKTHHKGIDSVSVVKAKVDTITTKKGTSTVANAFLSITYADKTKELVVVPMVKKGDLWLMK